MKRVIKASEMDSGAVGAGPMELPDVAGEARRILAEAGAEARRLVEEARRHAGAVQQEAVRRGTEEGLARGREEGLAEGRKQAREEAGEQVSSDLVQTAALARKVVEELAAARDEILQQARSQMLDFALELARKIVGRAAECDPEAARANLQKVLELAEIGRSVTVLVHPSQLRMLRRHASEMVEALLFRGKVNLAGDARIGPGGARLVSRQGEIDATIQTQLQNVVEALRGPAKTPAGPSENEKENNE